MEKKIILNKPKKLLFKAIPPTDVSPSMPVQFQIALSLHAHL